MPATSFGHTEQLYTDSFAAATAHLTLADAPRTAPSAAVDVDSLLERIRLQCVPFPNVSLPHPVPF
jgi:hypothetical protein